MRCKVVRARLLVLAKLLASKESAMFTLHSVEKRFGGQVVLDAASWAPPHTGLVGLVGPNGAGKTTLLRILMGEEELDGGRVAVPGGVTMGYLAQELAEADARGSVMDVLLAGRGDLLQLEERIDDVRRAIDGGDSSRVHEFAELQEDFERGGGYTFRAEARQIGTGLGFGADELQRPIQTFSGGWRMRAQLGKLLVRRPDVLLLDEPTNHLDTESLEWLESFIGRYEGLVVVVSHDRYFLNRMATGIAELQAGTITAYPGNWDAYRERKAEETERLAAAASRQAKEAERIRDFIERFRYKATKAKQVQSRVKALEKMESIEVPEDQVRAVEFRFPQPPRAPDIVARLEGVAKSYGPVEVWKGLDLTITRGDKIALMGPNGAGKTTLLKALADELAIDAGELYVAERVAVGYFAQHAVEQLDEQATIYQELVRSADLEVSKRVRSILGAFGFSGDEVDKPIGVLSGGEKNRVALAKMMLAPAGLLLLDEPTNHLDVASRQVLEYALRDFEGTYVVVSHDRYFVNEVAEKVVHLEDGRATVYLGDYDYYRWKRQEAEERNAPTAVETGPSGGSRKEARRAAAEERTRRKAATRELRAAVTAAEALVEKWEAAVAEAEKALLDPAVHADPDALRRWSKQHSDGGKELEAALERWEAASGDLEELEASLDGKG